MAKEETVSYKDFKKELKRRERKEKREQFFRNATIWINDNKEVVIIVTPILAGALAFAVKSVIGLTKGAIRTHNLNMETKLKENYCYDNSLGHYWELRRKLTNSEWVEINRRKKNGESLADILESLRVLA